MIKCCYEKTGDALFIGYRDEDFVTLRQEENENN